MFTLSDTMPNLIEDLVTEIYVQAVVIFLNLVGLLILTLTLIYLADLAI